MDIISVFETEGGSSILSGPANYKENGMKSITFKNKMNGERFVCDNTRAVEVIDGVEYLVVHSEFNLRPVMVRKDMLEKVAQNTSKKTLTTSK